MLPCYKTSFLPTDVWAIILDWIVLTNTTGELKNLSLVSRSIGFVADCHLWQDLTVESPGALVVLSKLILEHRRISQHLRSLSIMTTHMQRAAPDSTDMYLLQLALTRCTWLTALKLWLGAESAFCIHSLHISSLRKFSTDLPTDAEVLAFLDRHPQIEELHLGGDLVVEASLTHTYLLPVLRILEAPLSLAADLVPNRPVSRLKVWANYDGLSTPAAVADALRQVEYMRLSTAQIVSFRFEDGPPYASIVHHYSAGWLFNLKLLGLLFIEREEESQALELVRLIPGLEVLQIDNAMANRRRNSEQRVFVYQFGCTFKSLRLVSFEDDYQVVYWGRGRSPKNNRWERYEGVPPSLWRDI